MKKLFTLMATAALSMSMMAANYLPGTTHTITKDEEWKVTSDLTSTPTDQVASSWAVCPSVSVSNNNYKASANDNWKDASGVPMFKVATNGNVYNSAKKCAHFRVTGVKQVIAHGLASSEDRGLCLGINMVTSSLNENTAITEAAKTIGKNIVVSKDGLDPEKEYVVTVYAATNDTYFYGIEFIYGTPSTEPKLEFTPNEITLTATAFDKNPSAKVMLTGKNLTQKSMYPINFVQTEGISVSPENIEVQADGTVNQEITISYASTSPTGNNMVEMSVDVMDAQATLKVNYSCTGEEVPETVSTDTEWDWSKISTTPTIQLTVDSKPSKNDTILLANYPGIEHGVFNSRALYVCGEYLVRDSKYFQGGYIKFTTTAAGKVSVEFTNTGNRTSDSDIRYLYVNGVDTKVGSKETTKIIVAEGIEVEAGDVELTWQMPSAPDDNQYARVYKITFTEGSEPTAISNAAAELKAVKTIENGQLVIIKNGIRYNAAGAKL